MELLKVGVRFGKCGRLSIIRIWRRLARNTTRHAFGERVWDAHRTANDLSGSIRAGIGTFHLRRAAGEKKTAQQTRHKKKNSIHGIGVY